MRRLRSYPILLCAATAVSMLTAGCSTMLTGGGATSEPSASNPAAPTLERGIQPMTKVTEKPKEGYFSDPYPIHLAASDANSVPRSFAGSMAKTLSCSGQPTAGCFKDTALKVNVGPALAKQAKAVGTTLDSQFNNNIYQENSGTWQMAVSFRAHNPKHTDASNWTVVLHAHPIKPPRQGIPTEWAADALIAGSLDTPTKANYDGKFFEADGKLYLVYSLRLGDKPARDGIVAQLMDAPNHPARTPPTTLLAPGDYNSEYFEGLNQPSEFKLIETGNITEVDGKFLMAYSTGAFDEPGYKTGLAWSDTFLPAAGGQYRKLVTPDTAGVWGKPGQPEIRYLLQAQEPEWPNYIGKSVFSPGVPSVVNDAQHWYLFFAGYLPSNAPLQKDKKHYIPSFRRPYFAPLTVRIPAGATVAKTSDADLAKWVTLSQ